VGEGAGDFAGVEEAGGDVGYEGVPALVVDKGDVTDAPAAGAGEGAAVADGIVMGGMPLAGEPLDIDGELGRDGLGQGPRGHGHVEEPAVARAGGVEVEAIVDDDDAGRGGRSWSTGGGIRSFAFAQLRRPWIRHRAHER
jgi:hypothetical protein